jgi:large subunit ribosomal protein L9
MPSCNSNHSSFFMAKTEVILTHSVAGLGAESDHVKVAAGYARNYLYPQGFAIPLTGANKRRLEVLGQRRAEREAHEYNSMAELAKSVGKLLLVLKVKTGEDGKMFGSITAGAIADELKQQFEIVLDRRKIHLEQPLRSMGNHEVELRLHPEVTATLNVRIESTNPAAQLPAAAPEPKAEEASGDDRRRKGRPVRRPRADKPAAH